MRIEMNTKLAGEVKTMLLRVAMTLGLIVPWSVASANSWADPDLLARNKDIVSDASKANCTPELRAIGASGLVTAPDSNQPLVNRAIFRNIEGLGRPSDAFKILVAEPHEKLQAAGTRADLDSSWNALEALLGRSRSSAAYKESGARQWREFEALARKFHLCTVKSWFGIDMDKVIADQRAAQAAEQDLRIKVIADALASVGEVAVIYTCGGGGSLLSATAQWSDAFVVGKGGAAIRVFRKDWKDLPMYISYGTWATADGKLPDGVARGAKVEYNFDSDRMSSNVNRHAKVRSHDQPSRQYVGVVPMLRPGNAEVSIQNISDRSPMPPITYRCETAAR
jgi:hypothetical protein